MMTVSSVLNRKDDISSATRQRVQSVIDRLECRLSDIAYGLATKRTGTLGLAVPDVSNPFFSEVARDAVQVGYTEGHYGSLYNSAL